MNECVHVPRSTCHVPRATHQTCILDGVWVRGSSVWAGSVVFRLVFLFCIINFGLYFLLSLEFTLGFFTSFLADEYVQQEKDSEALI